MKTTEIKFDDGYQVNINERGQVSMQHKGKSRSLHASHYKEVPPESKAAAHLLKEGKAITDYLWAKPCDTESILRAGNGVREAVAAASEESKREQAERDQQFSDKRAAEIEAAKASCGLTDPVHVLVNYFDGWQTGIEHDGRKLTKVDWKRVCLGAYSFIERAALDEAVRQFDEAKAHEESAETARVEARKAEFQSKLSEARTTGQPVLLSRWTTNRCMNGHGNECSFDNAAKYLLPDGTTKTTYTCCY